MPLLVLLLVILLSQSALAQGVRTVEMGGVTVMQKSAGQCNAMVPVGPGDPLAGFRVLPRVLGCYGEHRHIGVVLGLAALGISSDEAS